VSQKIGEPLKNNIATELLKDMDRDKYESYISRFSKPGRRVPINPRNNKKELPPTIKNDKKEKKAGKAVQILQKIKRATQRQKEKEEIAAESESEDQFWEEEEEKSSDNK